MSGPSSPDGTPKPRDGGRGERRRGLEMGLRPVPGLGALTAAPATDERLVDRIRAEIAEGGPMTFARFMELALYDPEAGYYAADETTGGPGRQGDFLTAPEGHPIFGWAIARQLQEVWDRLGRPSRFIVREHGAGSGALAAGILGGLRRAGSALLDAIRYQAIEISDARLGRLRARLQSDGLLGYIDSASSEPAAGAVLANELLDALPVHRVLGSPTGDPRGPLLEQFVDAAPDGALTIVAAEPSRPELAARLATEGVDLAPGQVAEVCLAIDDWLARAAAPLGRGLVLLIDYGAPAATLYEPSRGSTLRTYHRHGVHDDPLIGIGRQDMTAHVDLTAVERAAATAGLERLGSTTQARFLDQLGLGELLVALQSDPGATLESYLAARSAVVRMLDPRATGGFAVLGFGRGLAADPPLRGFGPDPAPKRDASR